MLNSTGETFFFFYIINNNEHMDSAKLANWGAWLLNIYHKNISKNNIIYLYKNYSQAIEKKDANNEDTNIYVYYIYFIH